jgi:large subunit ribosomal protein L4
MQVAVKNQSGDVVDSIELNDEVFNVPMNSTLVHQAMVIYQSNRRQGTHDTKTRSEVSGGGRKPWIQKHTGRARQGSTRAPQWRHGGVVFGPHPRSHRKALPKRMRRHALRCVLSDKARNDRLVCLDSMDTIDGRTRSMATLLDRLDVASSAVVVTMDGAQEVVRAAGNLKKVYTLPVNQLNAEALLARDTLILTVDAARWAEQALTGDPHGRRGRKFATSTDEDEREPVAEEAPVVTDNGPAPAEAASDEVVANGSDSPDDDDTESPEDGE